MLIAHYKQTPIAQAPEAISEIINRYTDHNSYVFGYSYPDKSVDCSSSLVHSHNRIFDSTFPSIILYHSEPFRVQLDTYARKTVIAQYHATLKEYSDCLVVRNPIDIYNEMFLPLYTDKGPIRIAYSPSTLKPESKWADKGYKETVPILLRLKEEYKDKLEIDIIVDVSLEECLKRKSQCHIFIDEVKTPSYHRSGLEALAMGKVVICSLGPLVKKTLLAHSRAPSSPYDSVDIDNLESYISELIQLGTSKLIAKGLKNRLWMEKYWNPIAIASEYIDIYEKLLA